MCSRPLKRACNVGKLDDVSAMPLLVLLSVSEIPVLALPCVSMQASSLRVSLTAGMDLLGISERGHSFPWPTVTRIPAILAQNLVRALALVPVLLWSPAGIVTRSTSTTSIGAPALVARQNASKFIKIEGNSEGWGGGGESCTGCTTGDNRSCGPLGEVLDYQQPQRRHVGGKLQTKSFLKFSQLGSL